MYGVLTDEEIISRLDKLETIADFNLRTELPEVIKLLIEYEKTYENDSLFYRAHSVTDSLSKIFFTLTREAQDSARYAICSDYDLQEDSMYNSALEENMRQQVLYDGIVHYYKRHVLPESMDIGSLASLSRYLFEYIKEHTYAEYEDMLELAKKRG
ncbi:hypothetical protein SAMN02745945_00219 [Peptoclostridium litorale DSM 5388]|uniref:Uncharacterized protein n=1 Tax=Peptoclostridium litorale DSM 5388 TaxID=1121324 RepID=A0A069RHM8_PEPLI|nr:hypothetical protein [Peptoclostridium litorale]KDR96534.1 hypothetical protein CLIT_2c01400 [Peptoclostridium litorale DSM 5388]SIN69453.1 hypothetical protein SAMN02745945_00219 [Peptoclostridium litorale DSM 5388]